MHRVKLVFFLLLSTIILASCAGTEAAGQNTSASSEQPTKVVVRILNLDAVLTRVSTTTSDKADLQVTPVVIVSNTPDAPLPTPESAESVARTPTPSCTNQAEFVKHLTIADGTALTAGQPFAKIWQIKNSGTCTWTTDYSLVFYSGEAMSGPQSIGIQSPVLPGDSVDLRVDLVAPLISAASVGNWVMSDNNGNLFGVGPNSDQSISVAINVKPTPRPTPG